MGFAEIENAGKRLLAANPAFRHAAKSAYHHVSYALSDRSVKCEGDVTRVSPDDGREYFYGYYDKSPWSADERYMLCMRAVRTNESVAPPEPLEILLLDCRDGYSPRKIGESRSWNVQQGCMAQWLGPGFDREVIYNDFRDGGYRSVIVDVETGEERVLPAPVYDVSRDGSFALTLDFSRLHRLRPGYGYANLPDATEGQLVPGGPCIWRLDLSTGEVSGVLNYADLAGFEPRPEMEGAEHKVNHIMLNPSGTRFMVLHRWFQHGRKYTRLVTADADGSDIFNLSDDDFVSHCFWKSDGEIISFMRRNGRGDHYYLFSDKTHDYRLLWPSLKTDGHCSYSPDRSLVVTDTYPDRKRLASVYLCREDVEEPERLARVFAPFSYDFDTRCDLHPRWDRRGEKVCFDSVHEGKRGMYIIGIEGRATNSPITNGQEINRGKEGGPLISVVVPAYNSGKTLPRCLDSLIAQTDGSWECIVVDDGSVDDTNVVLSQYAAEGNIRVTKQDNLGPGRARNHGISLARGEYVTFLDSDDYLENTFVESARRAINEKDPDVLFYETVYENLCGERLRESSIAVYAGEAKHDFITRQMSGSISWGATKLIKIDLIEKTRASFADFDVGEEALFTFKVLRAAKSFAFIAEPLYHYIQSDQGQHRKGGIDPLREAVSEFKAYLVAHGIEKEYESALSNMALKALSMSLFRISKQYDYWDARQMMFKQINAYRQGFDLSKVDLNKAGLTMSVLFPFIRLKCMPAIYLASKIRR